MVLASLSLWGISKDDDLDGVPNEIDACLHTPFFEVVNKKGCSIQRLILPDEKENNSLDFLLGYTALKNEELIGEKQSRLSVALNYYRNDWIYGLSTSYVDHQTVKNIGNTLLTVKKRFHPSKSLKITTGIGINLPNNTTGNSTDYLFSSNVSYYPNLTSIFYLGTYYTLTNDIIDEESTQNQYGYILGGGYFLSKSLYASLFFGHTNNDFIDNDKFSNINMSLFYQFNEKYFASFTYSKGVFIDDKVESFKINFGVSLW